MADYSFIDLHTHTIHSHENMCTNSVSDVLNDAQRIAERSGKDCLVAITDHNSVLGVIEARSILSGGKYDKVKLISGAEFTVSMGELNGIFGGHDVFKNTHILAYGFDENNKELIEYSKKAHSGGKVLKYSQLVNLVKNAGGYLVIAHPGLIKINQKGLIGYTGEKYKDEIADIYRNAKSSKTILRHIPNGKVILELFYERLKKLSGGILIGMERFHPDNYFKQFEVKTGKRK